MENRFNIGDAVIALTSPLNDLSQPRVRGKKYIVNDILYCSKCGRQSINICSIKSPFVNLECNCGNIQPADGLFFTDSKYFIKASETTIKEKIEECISEEDYEMCTILRDLI